VDWGGWTIPRAGARGNRQAPPFGGSWTGGLDHSPGSRPWQPTGAPVRGLPEAERAAPRGARGVPLPPFRSLGTARGGAEPGRGGKRDNSLIRKGVTSVLAGESGDREADCPKRG